MKSPGTSPRAGTVVQALSLLTRATWDLTQLLTIFPVLTGATPSFPSTSPADQVTPVLPAWQRCLSFPRREQQQGWSLSSSSRVWLTPVSLSPSSLRMLSPVPIGIEPAFGVTYLIRLEGSTLSAMPI